MKTIKQVNPVKLLPFSFLVVPVVGEMVLNKEGLPTPWPVAIVSAVVSILSIFLVKAKKGAYEGVVNVEFGKLGTITSIYTLIRVLFGLFGSWNSLRVIGLNGFVYAELSFLAVLTLIPLIHMLKVFLWDEKRVDSSDGFLIVCAPVTIITVISSFWQIVSLGIYASGKNFLVNSQFITHCSSIPENTISIIVNCSKNKCFLTNRNLFILDLITRAIGSSIIIIIAIMANLPNFSKFRPESRRGFSEPPISDYWNSSKWGDIRIKKIVMSMIALFSSIYLILVAAIQTRALNTTGLEEVCDINPSLLSSKTGYLTEWFQQNWVALKQIALV